MLNTKYFHAIGALLTVADKAQYTIVFALFGDKSTTKSANKKKKTLINYNTLRIVLVLGCHLPKKIYARTKKKYFSSAGVNFCL